MATETSSTGTILRRYVRADGDDEPLVWYEGAGITDRRWYHSDERGSIVALSDSTGAMAAINKYDEYGIPGAGNIGRFQYTGQMWIAELGLYYYKARMYSPTLGKFMQTDPTEYEDGMNWYNYAGSDPINMVDPTGLGGVGATEGRVDPDIVVTWRPKPQMKWFQPIVNFVRGIFGASTPKTPAKMTGNDILDQVKDLTCSLPSVDIGFGADMYVGLGGSVGGGLKLDVPNGQVGAGFSVAVGVGAGIEVGPSISLSPSGSGVFSANITVSGGGGIGFGGTLTRNIVGTDPGQSSLSLGKIGTPTGFVNFGASGGFTTPKNNFLGCKQ